MAYVGIRLASEILNNTSLPIQDARDAAIVVEGAANPRAIHRSHMREAFECGEVDENKFAVVMLTKRNNFDCWLTRKALV